MEDTRDLHNIEYQNTKEGNSQTFMNQDPLMNRNSDIGVGCVNDQGCEQELDPTQTQAVNNIPCAKSMESDKNKKLQAQIRKIGPSVGQDILGVVENQWRGKTGIILLKKIYLGVENQKKSKNKDKRSKKQVNAKSSTFSATMKPEDILNANAYRKNKKAESSHKNQSSPNKSENSLTISEEIIKTKNVGSEVGFQIEGFDEMLRNEIEGEGMTKKQP
ncbi:hypothetical protein L1887_20417 [Cichorium endivia]|nr:hypothetical protein L1887_20417 [Cichorium endivia]